jgi:hypothetical protein
VKYLLRTEVHTFAFSVAANALLSFFPFVLLLMTLIRRVFRSPVMYDVVVQLLRDFLPAGQDFVIRNLNALVGARNQAQVVSLVILLVTSTGIFLPLEVALNRIWRFPNNRSYLGNQMIALCLAFSCGVLALLSIALTAGNIGFLEASAQWLPYVLKDLRRRLAAQGRPLPENPLQAFRLYVSCQTDDDVPYILQYVGEDNIVIGTDYGHSDQSTEIEALRNLRNHGGLEERAYRKITDDNARALYGL